MSSKRKSGSTAKKPPYLLWASVITGLLFVFDGVYYLVPAEGVRSRDMVGVNWVILGMFLAVGIWSLIDAIRGILRRNFRALIPFTLNLVWLVIYALAAAVEQLGE